MANEILIGGIFSSIGGIARSRIARLNSDGSLDTSFINIAVNNTVYSIAIQSDGKILIGGIFTIIAGVTRNRIARLNSDGSLDTGFDPNANGEVDAIVINFPPSFIPGAQSGGGGAGGGASGRHIKRRYMGRSLGR